MSKRFRTAYLELTNVCNRNCSFCSGTRRPPARMSEELFARLVPQVAELADQAYLHIMGEALLHPSLPEFTRIAADAALPLCMTTNGTLFGCGNAAQLENPVFHQLNISLHAGLPSETLDEICGVCDSLRSVNPNLRVNYRLWNVGSFETECARLAARYGVELTGFFERFGSVPLAVRLSLHRDRSFEWPSLDSPACSPRGFCHGGRRQFGVLCTGEVTACCLDADGVMNFGNAAEKPLKEILFSRRFEQMRNAFQRGEIREPLCLHCRYRERFSAKIQ